MAIGLDADSESIRRAGFPSGGAGSLTEGGFRNFAVMGWTRRPSAGNSNALTANGFLVHLKSGARELGLGFDNFFGAGTAADPRLRFVGDGFNDLFGTGDQPPFDENFCWYIKDSAGVLEAGWRTQSDPTWRTVSRANPNALSQFANEVTIGNTHAAGTPAVAMGHYSRIRAFAGSLTQSEIETRLFEPNNVTGDFFFWALGNNTDDTDGSGNGRTPTLTGTLTTESSPTLTGASPPTISSVTPASFANGVAGIVIAGANFGASQGAGSVVISPTDNVNDVNAVTQTVTAWGASSITITSVRSTLPLATNLYLFVETNGGLSNAAGSVVQFTTTVPTISNASDEVFNVGESITIEGGNFLASQGIGAVVISPTNNWEDPAAVTQTVTAWSNTSITITVVKGALSFDTGLFLFVVNNLEQPNATGYAVQITPRLFIRETLVGLDGAPLVSLTGITAAIFHQVPTPASPAPNQVLEGLSTDGSGLTAWEIARGALAVNAPVWMALFRDGSPVRGTLRKLTPSYE